MARRRAGKPRRKRWPLALFGLILCLALGLVAWMRTEARVVRLMVAEVTLDDLPYAFDGTTILFVSDLHANRYTSPEELSALMHHLAAANPDLILLGGDYTDRSTAFDEGGNTAPEFDRELQNRTRTFAFLSDLQAPLGKFGVSGNHDVALDVQTEASLRDDMALGGFQLLENQVVAIEEDGARLLIAGLDDWSAGNPEPESLSSVVTADDCVIVVSHHPDAILALNNAPCYGGGQWVDLMLSGHTHGGQIRLPWARLGAEASKYGDRYRSGWLKEVNAVMLVSNGVGTVRLPLRLGAPAQAHLITLRKSAPQ